MKRDINLVREVVLRIEGGPGWERPTEAKNPALAKGADHSRYLVDGTRDTVIQGHVDMLEHAGIVFVTEKNVRGFGRYALTWSGHDLADRIREDAGWSRFLAEHEASVRTPFRFGELRTAA